MQAILITAYKDFDYLKYLIHSLKDDEIFLFIHIDKRFYDEHFFDEYKNNEVKPEDVPAMQSILENFGF